MPDELRNPVKCHHTRRSRPVGDVLLWGFVVFALAYAAFLIVLGLTQ